MTVRTNRLAALSAAAATSVVLLAGCGTSTPTATNSTTSPPSATPSAGSAGATGSMPTSMMAGGGMPTSMMSTGGAMSSTRAMSTSGMPMPAQPAGPHNQADVTFAQQMTVHHQGAIAMADLAIRKAYTGQVKDLALQIKSAQAPEIKEMAGWLAAWVPDTDMNGMPNKTGTTMSGMGGMDSSTAAAMPGMMSDAQMGQLAAASGSAFDKLFLQMMIVHHQGALTMATTETAQGSNPEALALAKSITTSQTSQITQMKGMLQGR